MKPESLKSCIQRRLWLVVDAHDAILSATLTGSFLEHDSLEGVSDIDLVVVVENLNAQRFEQLNAAFDEALRTELAARGYGLRINSTLGPLKFNDPATAVLHLMLYSRDAHVDHVTQSPFTCFDWQRSATFRKRALAEIYPVFNLQPQHFMSSRRSVRDYLRDFDSGVVSYRELVCTSTGYREDARTRPMTGRDRHEFAYHILRFLMQNLVKLVRRANLTLKGEALLAEFFAIFPEREAEVRRFYGRLRAKKVACDFSEPLEELETELTSFVAGFEAHFRRMFFEEATRHVAFRHGPTAANRGARGQRVFLGRGDPPLEQIETNIWEALAEQVAALAPKAAYSSPLTRCRQSLDALTAHASLPLVRADERIREMDYGELEGLTVGASRKSHASLFEAWNHGQDPKFPGGENSRDVTDRALEFVCEHWAGSPGNTVTCTHNVVLRCLIGHVLGLPSHHWHRLDVPHLAPISFVFTRSHGMYVDIPLDTARSMFRDFATQEQGT